MGYRAQEALRASPALWLVDALVGVGGEVQRGVVLGEDLGDQLAAARNIDLPPLHVHHRNDETFYVLDGELRLFLSDREIVLALGQAVLAARGLPHAYAILGPPGMLP